MSMYYSCLLFRQLSEDMQHQSSSTQEETHTQKRTLEVFMEETMRCKPKAEARFEKQIAAVPEGDHDPPKLDEKQKKQLNDNNTRTFKRGP